MSAAEAEEHKSGIGTHSDLGEPTTASQEKNVAQSERPSEGLGTQGSVVSGDSDSVVTGGATGNSTVDSVDGETVRHAGETGSS
ncbi:MAG: hypothetical protein KY468_01735 [Armatimonadetes bacterium]|nr:hypothetical protein [Armatimonadota bacterium]